MPQRCLVAGLALLLACGPAAASPALTDAALSARLSKSPCLFMKAADRPAQEPVVATAGGTLNSIDTAARTVNISHAPIPPLGWPAMTMDFPIPATMDLSDLRPGQHVTFTIERDSAETYVVRSIRPESAGQE